MILRIRNSVWGKLMSFVMIGVFMITLAPMQGYALTGGPSQPEFNAFTPIGTSDMVDLASGDFSYNIPLMDVGGFPINIAYSSGITTDQEASWVGLGWNLSIGQINRQMRGIPDDFMGDEMLYENHIKPNTTVGATFAPSPEFVGVDKLAPGGPLQGPFNTSISAQFNTYDGTSLRPSLGVSADVGGIGSVGLSVTSTPDGLVVNPTASLKSKVEDRKGRDLDVKASIGTSFNSRQGLTSLNMSQSVGTKSDAKGSKSKWVGTDQKTSIGSSMSFTDNHYTPTIQNAMATGTGTFNAALGTEFTGLEVEAEITGYLTTQFIRDPIRNEKAYGFDHTQKANRDNVLDFNREKDGNFSVNSTNLPITNYTYDIYNVQGQGVSGMFHPYRSQVGYVFDNSTTSITGGGSVGIEAGVGNFNHFGIDVEGTWTNATSGLWDNKRNEALASFEENESEDYDYEEVYYKNFGDLAFDSEYDDIYGNELTKFGDYSPVRFGLTGVEYLRKVKNEYRIKKTNGLGTTPYAINKDAIKRTERVKRNQAIQKITAKEAGSSALKSIGFARNTNAADHHTAGFVITRNDGARYVYGKALYNTKKEEVTFALGDGFGGVLGRSVQGENGDAKIGLIPYDPGVDNSLDNKHGDEYYNKIQTPAYAHTYLLSTILSTDYSDIDGIEGPSEGDLGSYTRFTYFDDYDGDNDGNPDNGSVQYNWRVPFNKDSANFNEGLKTDPTDDKGSYVYGEKELTYIKEIETKTHVAVFYTSQRRDAIGVADENGGQGTGRMEKLDRVELYARGEYFFPGTRDINPEATPIKTAHFIYDYSLCKGIPNNDGLEHQTNWDNKGPANDFPEFTNEGGKLTLRKVFFTYRNSKMGRFTPYDFSYGDKNHDGIEDPERNPNYNLKAYDIWGCYSPNNGDVGVLDGLTAAEYNYVDQESQNNDDYTAAWTLTDITLPSSGKIQIDYESDDYAYVQNNSAMRMFKMAGAGDHLNPFQSGGQDKFTFDPVNNFQNQTSTEALLYKNDDEANYLYFELDSEDQTGSFSTIQSSFRRKYLTDLYNADAKDHLMQFRFLMNTDEKGGRRLANWKNGAFDYVTGYASIDINGSGVFEHNNIRYGSVKLRSTKLEGGFAGQANFHQIAKAGIQFTRKYLPKFVYQLPEVGENAGPKAALNTLYQAVQNVFEVFSGPNGLLKGKGIGRRFIPEKSWVRLNSPRNYKVGGGCRVKQLVMTDEWEAMTSDALPSSTAIDQKYGQEYTYKTENGASSGVATYEPIGSKENPFVQPVFVNVERMLAPDEQNYMEKPFGESFFPNPQVTYGRVAVKNIERVDNVTVPGTERVVKKHATGEVITEFYTSRDYPTIVDETKPLPLEDGGGKLQALLSFNVVKHLTVSQGYMIHVNDMNGKMRSQRVYAEGQEEFISGVDYIYGESDPIAVEGTDPNDPFALTSYNVGRINNQVNILKPDGYLGSGRIGVEQNIINDFREMETKTNTVGLNTNVATFYVGIPIVLPVPLPDYSRYQDKLSLATTTKVIQTFGVLKETVAHDAGASVYTRNLVWDSETGEVLLTETVNEFGDKYYSLNLPAHWYYDRMGMAAKNANMSLPFTSVDAPNGLYAIQGVAAGKTANDYLALGDELIITSKGNERAWVSDISAANDFTLIDEDGDPYQLSAGNLFDVMKIIRSGRRNIQATSMGSVVTLKNPLDLLENDGTGKLRITSSFLDYAINAAESKKIVNAGAVEFSENWELPCECGIDTDETKNPYLYNELGVWRAEKSHLYLTGREHNQTTDIRNDGFYEDFFSFYAHNGNEWTIANEDKWTFTSEVTQFNGVGFEIENKDALDRFSAAQYGYNFKFPMAVGANTKYEEMGYDGFEDYNFEGCETNEHFGFRDVTNRLIDLSEKRSHTGRKSLKVRSGGIIKRVFPIECPEIVNP